MTTKDFNLFQVNEPDFLTAQTLAFINRKLVEQGFMEDLIPYQTLLEDGKKALVDFYDSVGTRDLAFMQNMERIMDGGSWKGENKITPSHNPQSVIHHPRVAVLITGGYHTQHLSQLFQDKGYSYVVLTPQVTQETNQKKYEKLLLSVVRKEAKSVKVIQGQTREEKSLGTLQGDLAFANKKAGVMIEKFGERFAENPALGARLGISAGAIEVVQMALNKRTENPEFDPQSSTGSATSQPVMQKGARLAGPSDASTDFDSTSFDKSVAGIVQSGLMRKIQILYEMEVRMVVNPHDKPVQYLHGAAGMTVSDFLLSTDAVKGFFVSFYPDLTQESLKEALRDPAHIVWFQASVEWLYKTIKSKFGFAHNVIVGNWKKGRLVALVTELRSIGVDLKSVSVEQDKYGNPQIRFPWAYPGSPKKERTIVFINESVFLPDNYLKFLPSSIDGFYQKGLNSAPSRFSQYIPQIYGRVRKGGYFVTDNVSTIKDHTNYFTENRTLAFRSTPIPNEDRYLNAILSLIGRNVSTAKSAHYYGWRVRIHSKGSSTGARLASDQTWKVVDMASLDESALKRAIKEILFIAKESLQKGEAIVSLDKDGLKKFIKFDRQSRMSKVVFDQEGVLVGYLLSQPPRDGRTIVSSMGILESQRGRGAGSALMHAFARAALRESVSEVGVPLSSKYERTKTIFQRWGFEYLPRSSLSGETSFFVADAHELFEKTRAEGEVLPEDRFRGLEPWRPLSAPVDESPFKILETTATIHQLEREIPEEFIRNSSNRQKAEETVHFFEELGQSFAFAAFVVLRRRHGMIGHRVSSFDTAREIVQIYFPKRLKRFLEKNKSNGDLYLEHVARLLDFYDLESSRSTTEKIGQFYANLQHRYYDERRQQIANKNGPTYLPFLPSGSTSTQIHDYASGSGVMRLIPYGYDKAAQYVLHDNDPFIISALRTFIRLEGVSKNFTVVDQSVLDLEPPESPIAVLRLKNVWNYVPGFAGKLREIAENPQWIEAGGRILLQGDQGTAHLPLAIEQLDDSITHMLDLGWTVSMRRAKTQTDFDTIELEKPRLIVSDINWQKRNWRAIKNQFKARERSRSFGNGEISFLEIEPGDLGDDLLDQITSMLERLGSGARLAKSVIPAQAGIQSGIPDRRLGGDNAIGARMAEDQERGDRKEARGISSTLSPSASSLAEGARLADASNPGSDTASIQSTPMEALVVSDPGSAFPQKYLSPRYGVFIVKSADLATKQVKIQLARKGPELTVMNIGSMPVIPYNEPNSTRITPGSKRLVADLSEKTIPKTLLGFSYAMDVLTRRIQSEHLAGEEGYYSTILKQKYFDRTGEHKDALEILTEMWFYQRPSNQNIMDSLERSKLDRLKFLKEVAITIFRDSGEDIILTGVIDALGRQDESGQFNNAWMFKNFTGSIFTFQSDWVSGPLQRINRVDPAIKYLISEFSQTLFLREGFAALSEDSIEKAEYLELIRQDRARHFLHLRPYFKKLDSRHKNDRFSHLIGQVKRNWRVASAIYPLVKTRLDEMQSFFAQVDMILPAPSIRLENNQAIPLAEMIGREAGKPVHLTALVQTRPRNRQQKYIGKLLRRARNAGALFEGDRSELKGKNVLIVDDNETTGFTAHAMRAAALAAGAKEVHVLSFGKSAGDKKAVAVPRAALAHEYERFSFTHSDLLRRLSKTSISEDNKQKIVERLFQKKLRPENELLTLVEMLERSQEADFQVLLIDLLIEAVHAPFLSRMDDVFEKLVGEYLERESSRPPTPQQRKLFEKMIHYYERDQFKNARGLDLLMRLIDRAGLNERNKSWDFKLGILAAQAVTGYGTRGKKALIPLARLLSGQMGSTAVADSDSVRGTAIASISSLLSSLDVEKDVLNEEERAELNRLLDLGLDFQNRYRKKVKNNPTVQSIHAAIELLRRVSGTRLANLNQPLVKRGYGARLASTEDLNALHLLDLVGANFKSITSSANGNILVVGYQDDIVKVFDLVTKEDLQSLIGPNIKSATLSADGNILVVKYQDNTVKVFDLATKEDLQGLIGPDVYHIIPSANKNILAVEYKGNSAAKVFDLVTKVDLQIPIGRDIQSITPSANGNILVVRYNGDTAKVFDLATKEDLQIPIGTSIYSATLSANGNALIVVYMNDTVKVFDLVTKENLRSLIGSNVHSIRTSTNGNILVVRYTYYGDTAKVFDLATKADLQIPIGPNVKSTTLSANGNILYVRYEDDTIKIFDLVTKEDLQSLIGPNVNFTTASDNGNILVAKYNGDTAKVFDLASKEDLQSLIGPNVRSATPSANGNILYVRYEDNTIKIFDLATKEDLQSLIGPNVRSATPSENRSILVVGYHDNSTKVFDLATKEDLQSLIGDNIHSIVPSANKNNLVVIYKDNTVKVFDLGALRGGSFFSSVRAAWGDSAFFGLDLLSWMLQWGEIKTPESLEKEASALSPFIERFNTLTTDYNRPRIISIFKESRILDYLVQHQADWRRHLNFDLDLMESNKRLSLQILEGVFQAIKEGMITTDLPDQEKEKILHFIKITRNFNPALYAVYQKEGEAALQDILDFATKRILTDQVGQKELKDFQNTWSDKGYDPSEILLGAIQRAIPPSGASFVKKDEIKGLLEKFIQAGDRRTDIPKKLRDLGRFGGGVIQRFEWRLRSGESFDPDGRLRSTLNALRYLDSGKEDSQKEKDMQEDRAQFVLSLKELLADRASTDKTNKALQAFYAYARHNDLLKEKIDRLQDDSHQNLELLEQLFMDKDNLTILVRDVFGRESLSDGADAIRDVGAVEGVLNGLWRSNQEDKEGRMRKSLSKFQSSEITAKLLRESSGLDPEIQPIIRQLLQERASLSHKDQLELIENLFEEPLATIGREKERFERTPLGDPFKLRFQVVKGIPFGLWGLNAGVCIATDLELWNKKEFYLLAMIDESKEEAVGFMHLFEERNSGKLNLTVPGLEPSVEFLGQVKAEEVYPLMEEALATVATTLGLAHYDIPTDPNILSNRTDNHRIAVQREKSGVYKKVTLPYLVEWNTLPKPYSFNEVYRVSVGARLGSTAAMPATNHFLEINGVGGRLSQEAIQDKSGISAEVMGWLPQIAASVHAQSIIPIESSTIQFGFFGFAPVPGGTAVTLLGGIRGPVLATVGTYSMADTRADASLAKIAGPIVSLPIAQGSTNSGTLTQDVVAQSAKESMQLIRATETAKANDIATLVKIPGRDLFGMGMTEVVDMLERAKPLLAKRGIALEFIGEEYSAFTTKQAGVDYQETLLASKESVLAMDVSADSGLTLIQPESDKIIAILVAIITAADAKRGVDPLITERRMRYLTGDDYLKLSKDQAGYLAKIPSDFAQNKEEHLNAIYVPLAIKALNLIGEQIIGYAKMMLAVGSSA